MFIFFFFFKENHVGFLELDSETENICKPPHCVSFLNVTKGCMIGTADSWSNYSLPKTSMYVQRMFSLQLAPRGAGPHFHETGNDLH